MRLADKGVTTGVVRTLLKAPLLIFIVGVALSCLNVGPNSTRSSIFTAVLGNKRRCFRKQFPATTASDISCFCHNAVPVRFVSCRSLGHHFAVAAILSCAVYIVLAVKITVIVEHLCVGIEALLEVCEILVLLLRPTSLCYGEQTGKCEVFQVFAVSHMLCPERALHTCVIL